VLERFQRLVDEQNRVTRAYHERKAGSIVRALIVGDSKKDPSRLTAKTLDNVTVVAPKPYDYAPAAPARPHPYAQTPWLDIAIESGHVWGCMGRVVRRAARFAEVGEPAMPGLVDLTALQPELPRR
jgi:tRNA A37 methylthiotransferase MiaB